MSTQSYKANLKLWASIGTVILVIILRDIAFFSVPGVGILSICVILMAWLPFSKLMPFLFFLFPLTCGIPGYIMLAGYLFMICKGPKLSASQIVPVVIIAVLDFFNEGISGNGTTYTGMLSFISFCAIFFYILNDKSNRYDISEAIFYFTLGTLFTFAVIFINMFRQYDLNYILAGMVRSGALGIQDNDTKEMAGHLAMNANTIAYYSLCSISCLLVNLKSYKNQLICISVIVLIAFCGFLTLSRTYLLCIALFAILYFFSASKSTKLGFIIGCCILACGIMYFAADYVSHFYESMTARTEDSNFATAGGRTLLFKEYNEAWSKSFLYILFGCGVVDHMVLLKCSNAMHSGIQQVWVCLGLVGLIIFIQQVLSYLLRYFKFRYFVLAVPFLVTLIFDQSIQFLNPYPLMLPIVVALLVVKIPQYHNKLK